MTIDEVRNPRAVVVIGGSAGSLPALLATVGSLPADLPAAVLVTIHVGQQSRSKLAEILSRASPLPTVRAEDNARLTAGSIYVGPPGRHMLVGADRVLLSAAPRVNRHRPAVDVLFASAARSFLHRVVAVVMSGVLDDGAVGAALVAAAGGTVMVQDPAAAEFYGMPAAALAAAPGARAYPAEALGQHVVAGVDALLAQPAHYSSDTPAEDDMAMSDSDDPGFLFAEETQLTRLACPECGGGMAQVDLPQISYFRCHVGHQYAPKTLAAAQAEAVEAKLWSAIAAMEEQAVMGRYLRSLPNGRGGYPVGSPDETVELIAERASALREQVRTWMPIAPEIGAAETD